MQLNPQTDHDEFSGVLTLSPGQYRVFLAIGMGLSTREVSEKLQLSTKTLDTHYMLIKSKLGMPHLDALRCLAARFIALRGMPKLVTKRIFQGRFHPSTE